jgi:hypothetical protein
MADHLNEDSWLIRTAIAAVFVVASLTSATQAQRMTAPSTTIKYLTNDFAVSDLTNRGWNDAGQVRIATYWNGARAPDGRQALVLLLWSDKALYVRFDMNQAEPLVVSDKSDLAKKTMRLWDRDVCELFLASDGKRPRRYAEFEVAPTGEWLDLMVDWTKDEPRDWDYLSGMESAAEIAKGKVTIAMKIPWSAFGRAPSVGEVWRGNLFRQVGSGDARGYLAWSPTMTESPQFHVPDKFGEFVFVR